MRIQSEAQLAPEIQVSLPGLTGQSSIPGRWLLDRPVKPGDDSTEVGHRNRPFHHPDARCGEAAQHRPEFPRFRHMENHKGWQLVVQ